MATYIPLSGVRDQARPSSAVPYLLINPPLTSPTNPYHSIPYLVGKTRSDGFIDYRCLDANIEALNYLARAAHVETLLEKAAQTRNLIEGSQRLTRYDELRYQEALAALGLTADFAQNAIGIFRDRELFYHYPTYRQAVMAIRRWLTLLSQDGAPAMFDGFGLRTNGVVNYSSHRDLGDEAVIDMIAGPFLPYINGPLVDVLQQRDWELVGISVNYRDQLPVALRIARQVRSVRPAALIVFGGTEVCDDIKYSRETGAIWGTFRDADVLVPGEGESPLSEILAAVRDGVPCSGIRGVLTRDSGSGVSLINYENVADLPTPAYDVWDWSPYWTPEPVVNYSPTRGCYWNKCTFCDYGLNTDRPTAPSRERPVQRAVADLHSIEQLGKTVYFAVDAMSPRYLRALCEAMAQSPQELLWSAELRLERTFPKRGVAELLKRAGCVSVSFGYESGSQRILDLIDKGVKIDDVPAILGELAAHDIGVQMMGFTGFPSERPSEARATYDFLICHGELWSLAGIGSFQLTPGSIVARQPDRFGIEVLSPPDTDDIQRFLPWRDRAGERVNWPREEADAVNPRLKSSLTRCFDDRPFVGGIDSAHSLLYFARYGKGLLPQQEQGDPVVRLVDETSCTVPFDNLNDFTTPQLLEERYAALQSRAGATCSSVARWLDQIGVARSGSATVVVLATGVSIALPDHLPDDGSLGRMVRLVAQACGAA